MIKKQILVKFQQKSDLKKALILICKFDYKKKCLAVPNFCSTKKFLPRKAILVHLLLYRSFLCQWKTYKTFNLGT